jgi:predicted  nucleic acid-binding Zn-ribbon protein
MPLIDNLLTLFNVDRQVRGLRGRLESAQIYLDLQSKQLQEIELERSENDQQRMQRKANIANIETETASIDVRIDTLRTDLNKAVNDKQYSALLAEVNTIKERRKAFEDEELIEMAAVEGLDQIAAEINERAEERNKVLQIAAKELETRKAGISEQLAELECERQTAAAIIPSDTLATFDEIADDYDGESMAAIEIIDHKRKEYSCTSCSLRLPLESVTTLMGTGESLVRCGSCDRILYLEAETRDLITPGKKD